jgi:hypothetical protein
MPSALPFVVAIVFATIGAFVPDTFLQWLMLLAVLLALLAVLSFPFNVPRHTLRCPVCGFRKQVKAPTGNCPILHDCPYCGAHSVPHPDDPCFGVLPRRHSP